MNHETEEATDYVLSRFVSPNPQSIRFERFTLIHPNSVTESRSLVIGATDWLLQLDYQSFALLHNRSMIGSGDEPKPYHCQALICDEQRNWLIACGTNGHGQCSIHDLNNISSILYEPKESVVSDNPNGSTVVLIGPGPILQSNMSNTALYVASTSNDHYRNEIVATRSLQVESLMQLVYADISSGTRLYLNNAIAGHFYLEYIYAFQSNGFTFFIVVESTQNRKDIITKLVRICQNDNRYYSYTEVPLRCHSNRTVSKARRAFHLRSPVESNLYEHLVVIFDASGSSSHNAVCMYQLSAIQAQIDANIAKCFDGQGFQNIHY
ncbi:hypothetical protein BLA29_006937, partial [Euroglyphus maynei]